MKGDRPQRRKQITASSERLQKEELDLTSECWEGTDYANAGKEDSRKRDE